MVNIYLNINGGSLPFLSIPNTEILRLSTRPFPWICYVMYSICGARGDISATPNGPLVNYDSNLLADDIDLYYNPSGHCIFVDHKGLNDQITSSSQTIRRHDFRRDIVNRDGDCIISHRIARLCDATHLVPRSKGNEYINKLMQDRSPLYESPPSISEIDAVENGVLLGKELHALLRAGWIAFLKTPNYGGLQPTDILRHERGPARGSADYITLHRLKLDSVDPAYSSQSHFDAIFEGSHSSLPLPPAIILDYMYGVAAYNLWRSNQEGVHDVMSTYHEEHFADIPQLHQSPSANERDNTFDLTYTPTASKQRYYKPSGRDDEMIQAMDELNLVMMHICGTSPQELAEQREKQEEHAQETSQSKVMEWLGHSDQRTDLLS